MATSGLAGYSVLALVAVPSGQMLEQWDLNFRSGMCGFGAALTGSRTNQGNLETRVCCQVSCACEELPHAAFQESGL